MSLVFQIWSCLSIIGALHSVTTDNLDEVIRNICDENKSVDLPEPECHELGTRIGKYMSVNYSILVSYTCTVKAVFRN